jgi:hypothetical protein
MDQKAATTARLSTTATKRHATPPNHIPELESQFSNLLLQRRNFLGLGIELQGTLCDTLVSYGIAAASCSERSIC